MLLKNICCCCILLTSWLYTIAGVTPLSITNSFTSKRVYEHVTYYSDTTNALGYQGVLKLADRFKVNKDQSLSFGYHKEPLWIKLVIKNNSTLQDFVFELENTHLDIAELYQLRGDTLVSKLNRLQLYYSGTDGDVLPATLSQKFKLKKGTEVTFLLKIKAISSLITLITIYQDQEYRTLSKLKLLRYSIFTGILAFVFIFSLFLFYVIKDWVYLYYAGYVVSFWCSIISLCGYFFDLLPFGMFDLRQLLAFFIVFFALQFTILFLSVKKFSPELLKKINYVLVYVLICFVTYLFHCFGVINIYNSKWFLFVAAIMFNLMVLFTVIIITISILQAIMHGYITGWFYLVSLLPVLIITVLIVLSNFSIIPYYNLIGSYYVFACAFEFSILFLGLAYRFKTYKDEQARLLIENANQQKELVNTLVTGQEIERKRISEELHDSLGQWLTITQLQLNALTKENITEASLQKTRKYIERSISELRHISHDMMPIALIHGGIAPAIEELVKALNKTGKMMVSFYCDEALMSLGDKQTEIAYYRIVQESLTNIVKHANATEASIQLTLNQNTIQLMIEDNGLGFDINKVNNGKGIKNILSRVQLLGGQFEISSSPGKGTLIHVEKDYTHHSE